MPGWPPATPDALAAWCEGELHSLRRNAREISDRLLRLNATAYVPVSARYSHTKVARTGSLTDPVFDNVLKLVDLQPEWKEQLISIGIILRQWENAKLILTDEEHCIIHMRYEQRLSPKRISEELFISRSTYFRRQHGALSAMCRMLNAAAEQIAV